MAANKNPTSKGDFANLYVELSSVKKANNLMMRYSVTLGLYNKTLGEKTDALISVR